MGSGGGPSSGSGSSAGKASSVEWEGRSGPGDAVGGGAGRKPEPGVPLPRGSGSREWEKDDADGGPPRARRRRVDPTDSLPSELGAMPGLKACADRAMRRIDALGRLAGPQEKVRKAWARRLALCKRLWHAVDQTSDTARRFVATSMADEALVRRAAGIGAGPWRAMGVDPASGPGGCLLALERDRQWARVVGLLCCCVLRQLRRETLRASRVLWHFVGGPGCASLRRCLRLVLESVDELGLRSEAALAALRAQVDYRATAGGKHPGNKTALARWCGGVDAGARPDLLGAQGPLLPGSMHVLLSECSGQPIQSFQGHPRAQVLERVAQAIDAAWQSVGPSLSRTLQRVLVACPRASRRQVERVLACMAGPLADSTGILRTHLDATGPSARPLRAAMRAWVADTPAGPPSPFPPTSPGDGSS